MSILKLREIDFSGVRLMTKTVGRNDLCPCGSGKKYKKCCEQNQVVSIHHLLKDEILELHREIYDFAFSQYGDIIEDDFDLLVEELILEEQSDEEFFRFVHAFWFILFGELDDDSTILENYIQAYSKKLKRPKLQQVLLTWRNAEPIVGKVVNLSDEEFKVESVDSGDVYHFLVINNQRPTFEGAFLFGFMLPFENQYVMLPSPFQVPDGVENFEEFIKKGYETSVYSMFKEYLIDNFIEIMNRAPYSMGMVDSDNMDWDEPIYQEVAEIFEKEMRAEGENPSNTDAGILLWYKFCKKRPKRIKNPNIYASALLYLISNIFTINQSRTQSGLGKMFGVSPNSISKAVKEMEEVLEDDLNEIIMEAVGITQDAESGLFVPAGLQTEQMMQGILADLKEQDFNSFEEVQQYLNQTINQPIKQNTNKATSKQAEAQDLIYEAYNTHGKKRYDLAKKVLELNPNNADAYNILAEQVESFELAMSLYKKGMEAGEKDLGKAFFKKNKGHFWGLIETRPYMRAKANYAAEVHKLGFGWVAIKHYEELLTLNPNDNQGVRYSLFITYVETEQVPKAKELLKKYPEGSAQGTYNELLIELLENGFTAKAAKLKKTAVEANKYVIGYLTGKTKIPKRIPETYSWGDKNEAIIYADQHIHLWGEIPGLREWLGK